MARLQGWKWALAGAMCLWAGLAASQTLGWAQRPGSANDVGIGDDGSVWVVGTDPEPGNNFGIHRWRGDRWEKVAGGAVRIAVGPQGQPWIVNRANQIQYLTGSGWYLMPGAASYIEDLEPQAIEKALQENRYNKTKTAAALGITFRALRYKLKKLGID